MVVVFRIHQPLRFDPRESACISGQNFLRYSSSPSNRNHDQPRMKMMNADQGSGNAGGVIIGVGSAVPVSPDGTRPPDPFSRSTSKMAPRIASLLRDLSIRRIRPGSSPSFSLITSVQNPVCSSLVRSRNKPGIAETAMFEPAPSPVLARSGSRTREIKRRGRQALQARLDPGRERRGQSTSLISRPRARSLQSANPGSR